MADKILIVDDDSEIREVVRILLAGENFQVAEAAGGAEASGRRCPLFSADSGLTPLLFLLGLAVALLGLFRGPFTDAVGGAFGIAAPHSLVHPAFWWLYAGAFVTGAAFLLRVKAAPYIGTLFFACALAAVCVIEATPLARFFLVIITLIGLVVAVYSLNYIHDGRKGWYWFFLLLTFASLAGIVSASNTLGMYGYWELMTFASYFLVVHEERQAAFDAGLKYYVMCAARSSCCPDSSCSTPSPLRRARPSSSPSGSRRGLSSVSPGSASRRAWCRSTPGCPMPIRRRPPRCPRPFPASSPRWASSAS